MAASLDHVLGDARLRDLKSELKQFTVDARRAPKWVLDAHPSDQRAQIRLNLRPPSPRTLFPTPVVAKAGSMPMHERLGADNREDLQDRRKPSIQLDKEPAVVVREQNPMSDDLADMTWLFESITTSQKVVQILDSYL